MTVIRMPDGQNVRFPDDMPKEQIKSFIATKFPELGNAEQKQPLTQEQRDRAISNAKSMMKEYTPLNAISDFAEGVGRFGASTGSGILDAITFGGADKLQEKYLGTKVSDEMAKDIGVSSKIGKGIGEIAGAIPVGGAVAGATRAGLKAVPKVGGGLAKWGTGLTAGAIEGGLAGGINTGSLAGVGVGAGLGGVLGGTLDVAGNLVRGYFSPNKITSGIKGGKLEDIASSRKGREFLKDVASVDDNISDELLTKIPSAQRRVNIKAVENFDDAIGKRVDLEKTKELQNAEYQSVIDKNAGDKIVSSKQIKEAKSGMSKHGREELGRALNFAKGELKGNTAGRSGTLEHISKAKENLNKKLGDAYNAKSNVASERIEPLQDAKRKVDNWLLESETGLKKVDKKISFRKRLEDAREKGQKFTYTPENQPKFKTTAEKRSFAVGLKERMTTNPSNTNINQEILKNQDVLEKVLPKGGFKKLIENAQKDDLTYRWLSIADKTAEKPTSQLFKLFAREQGESKGALRGTVVDYLKNVARRNQLRQAYKNLTNPDFVQPLLNEQNGNIPASISEMIVNSLFHENKKGEQ